VEISLRRLIPYGGAATLIAITALAITQALLGSPLFFALTAVLCAVYALLLRELLGVSGPVPEQNLQHHPLDCPAAPSATTCVRPRRITATSGSDPNRRLLIAALLFAVAFRTATWCATCMTAGCSGSGTTRSR
jgi:hypothetical protein